jgi:hypothetical protein
MRWVFVLLLGLLIPLYAVAEDASCLKQCLKPYNGAATEIEKDFCSIECGGTLTAFTKLPSVEECNKECTATTKEKDLCNNYCERFFSEEHGFLSEYKRCLSGCLAKDDTAHLYSCVVGPCFSALTYGLLDEEDAEGVTPPKDEKEFMAGLKSLIARLMELLYPEKVQKTEEVKKDKQ